MTSPLRDVILSVIAAAIDPGTLIRCDATGQCCEWAGVEGGEVLLRCLGGWADGTVLRRPVVEVMSRWTLCRSDC